MTDPENLTTSCAHLLDTPLGWMRVEGSATVIQKAGWIEEDDATIQAGTGSADWAKPVESQAKEYFAGKRLNFQLPFETSGTEFQEVVWKQLLQIPQGESLTYLDVAQTFGNRNFSQAVGNAVGANPILLFIPCHRVIGSDGSLTGYAGGIERKKWLLEHEGALAPERQLRLF